MLTLRNDAGAGRRGAFTLIEVVVGLAAVIVVGAIALAVTTDLERERRVAADVDLLRELTSSVQAFDTGVTVFPSSLIHLTTRPLSTDDNSCGVDFGAAGVTNWTNSGPFYSQPIVDTITLEVGKLLPTMTRVGATTPATIRAILQMSVVNVDISDAIEVNRQVDSDAVVGNASTTGVVQFPAPGVDDKTTFTWNMAIRGC